MTLLSYRTQLNKQVGAECRNTRRPAADQALAGQRRDDYRIQFGPLPFGGGSFCVDHHTGGAL